MQNIHASCFEFKKRGVILRGDSGSGKSDVLLKAIVGYGAKLISDDRTDVCIKKSTLIASSPLWRKEESTPLPDSLSWP